MLARNEETGQNAGDKPGRALLIVRWVLIFIGLCCFLQFIVVGIIGVVRGYSVQGFWSSFVMYSGASFVLLLTPRRSKEFKKKSIFYLVSIMIMYSVLIRGAQGDHYKRGEEYYTQGRYQKALQEFKKETQTWYLRLDYNHNESRAMLLMAETYCQLADFDKARETYKLILRRRYRYYQRKRAGTGLGRLELGLKIAAKYEAWVSGEADFPYDLAEEELKSFNFRPEQTEAYILYDIASAYQYDVNCYAKAVEVYRKIVDMDIRESTKERARKKIKELTAIIQK